MKFAENSLIGEWTLAQPLGTGGNGVVWACRRGEQEGALKQLHPRLYQKCPDQKLHEKRRLRVRRFVDEIQFLQSRVRQPGIMQLLDAHLPTNLSERNPAWFVMELGTPLRKHLSTKRSLEEIIRLFASLASTLADLHDAGVSHRDIKPENILVTSDGVKFGDFGLVDFLGKTAETVGSEILGPLFYIAPEMRSESPELNYPPADVYSLAKTLWVAATDQNYPLPGEQRVGIPALSLGENVSNPRAKLLDPLIDICTRQLANERPSSRYVANELTAWLHNSTNDLTPLAKISEQAGMLNPTNARLKASILERKATATWAAEMMNRAAESLRSLDKALSAFAIVGYEAEPMPTRLLIGTGLPFMDIEESPYPRSWTFGDRWYSGVGTRTDFVAPLGRAVLGCGVLLSIDEEGRFVMVAVNGHSTTVNAGGCKVIWTQTRIETARSMQAQVALDELVQELISEAPNAVQEFVGLAIHLART